MGFDVHASSFEVGHNIIGYGRVEYFISYACGFAGPGHF